VKWGEALKDFEREKFALSQEITRLMARLTGMQGKWAKKIGVKEAMMPQLKLSVGK
jgi:hypothetical protein